MRLGSRAERARTLRRTYLLTRATEVLGTVEKANHWLDQPLLALDMRTPASLLDSAMGARDADAILTRIEFGVFS